MRILFFGTPEFAAVSLKAIVHAGFDVVAVVTAPDKPAGRGQKLKCSEVKEAALDLNIPVLQPTNLKSEDFAEQLTVINPDLGVVIAFRMLPESVWSLPKLGTVNLHGSLLPDYRGAAPIQHAIINGETQTGVSTFFLKHEIDTGNIIDQAILSIGENENAGSLHDRMMLLGAEVMVNTISKINQFGAQTPSTPQSNLSTKFAPKIHRDFCELTNTLSTKDAFNKIRGLSPYPGAWIQSPWGDMKIFEAQPIELEIESIPSEAFVLIHNRQILLKCSDGFLQLNTIQLPGKPRMKSLDFINGLK